MGYYRDYTIKDAIQSIHQNRFLIPAFQRDFVWNRTQVENLFDSIMRGYPINSLLFWEVTGKDRSAYEYYQFLQEHVQYHRIHGILKTGCDSMDQFMAVLDGQQRLTAVFLGMCGTMSYHIKYRSWEYSERDFPKLMLYLNLTEIKEDQGYNFRFRPKVDGRFPDLIDDDEGKWFRCGAILSLDNIEQFKSDHTLTVNEATVLTAFDHSVTGKPAFHVYVENGVSSDRAVDIFVRINSGGKILSLSDISLSLVVAGWKNLNAKEQIWNLSNTVSGLGFSIDHDYVIKAFLYLLDKPVKTKISTFNTAFISETETNWGRISESIRQVFQMLKDLGFNYGTLTSTNATLPLLYYVYKNGLEGVLNKMAMQDQRLSMKNWLMKTLLMRSFGGSSDNTLTLARKALSLSTPGGFPADAVSEAIRQPHTIGQELIDQWLGTQKDNAFAFSILALLYPDMDLSNKFDQDHLHPVALHKQYYDAHPEINDSIKWSRYNSIVNLQLLGANLNRSKGDTPLKEWVRNTLPSRPSLYEETYIPIGISLETSNFEEFYSKRKELLTVQLCTSLGVTLSAPSATSIETAVAFADDVDDDPE